MMFLIFILYYLLVNVSSMLTDHINQSPVTISKSFGNNYNRTISPPLTFSLQIKG